MGGNGPLIQPPTTRIGGGGSAHAVAIGVVVVLVALVWVGWSGRPTGQPVGAQLLPSGAAAPTAVGAGSTPSGPTSGPTAPTPRSPSRGPTETRSPSSRLADDVYVITAGFAGGEDGAILQLLGATHLQGLMYVPASQPDWPIMLRLHQLSSAGMSHGYGQLGEWELSIDEFAPDAPEGTRVLDVQVAAQPDAANPSLLVRRGFTVVVHAEARRSIVQLTVDISLSPPTRRPADEDHRIFPFIR